MWHLHSVTGARGWHICQLYLKEHSDLLVFVQQGDLSWKAELWKSRECTIIPKNFEEEVEDGKKMSGFPFRGSKIY